MLSSKGLKKTAAQPPLQFLTFFYNRQKKEEAHSENGSGTLHSKSIKDYTKHVKIC